MVCSSSEWSNEAVPQHLNKEKLRSSRHKWVAGPMKLLTHSQHTQSLVAKIKANLLFGGKNQFRNLKEINHMLSCLDSASVWGSHTEAESRQLNTWFIFFKFLNWFFSRGGGESVAGVGRPRPVMHSAARVASDRVQETRFLKLSDYQRRVLWEAIKVGGFFSL